MKALFWWAWGVLSLIVGGYLIYTVTASEEKEVLLIGEASHGHFQIELACSSCHTDPFGGTEILQNACVDCHGDELKKARDSHPQKKFTDPRNSELLEILDARYCVSCHTEHQKEQTHPMGVTLPDDYCYHCHVDIGKNRPSHKDLAFDSCATSGCHNFHDNRALFEDFLVANGDGPWLQEVATLASANHAAQRAPSSVSGEKAFTQQMQQHADITEEVALDAHGEAGVSCGGCHTSEQGEWLEKPGVAECQTCHQGEAKGFLTGKHGMKLAAGLGPMTPEHSSMAFKPEAMSQEQGCTSCHGAHQFDRQQAAVQACLGCHDDDHSKAFLDSPHGQTFLQASQTPDDMAKAVTCATCHMPRMVQGSEDSQISTTALGEDHGKLLVVEHNQNMTLRPNEKMIRPVCMSCHSLEFAIDALADPDLIKNNFKGKPQNHVPSIDWAKKRVK